MSRALFHSWAGAASNVAAPVFTRIASMRLRVNVARVRSLLLPGTFGILEIPASACLADPLFGERGADFGLPLRMLVGDGDFTVDRGAIAIVIGDGLLERGTIGQCKLTAIAQFDQAIALQPQRAAVEMLRQAGREACRHPLLDGLDRRRLDAQIGGRMGAADR